MVASCIGSADGSSLGLLDGCVVAATVGSAVGARDGCADGAAEGAKGRHSAGGKKSTIAMVIKSRIMSRAIVYFKSVEGAVHMREK